MSRIYNEIISMLDSMDDEYLKEIIPCLMLKYTADFFVVMSAESLGKKQLRRFERIGLQLQISAKDDYQDEKRILGSFLVLVVNYIINCPPDKSIFSINFSHLTNANNYDLNSTVKQEVIDICNKKQIKNEFENIFDSLVSKNDSKILKLDPDKLFPKNSSERAEIDGYIGNKRTSVYHYDGCRVIRRISSENIVFYENEQEVRSSGFKPCSRCMPSLDE